MQIRRLKDHLAEYKAELIIYKTQEALDLHQVILEYVNSLTASSEEDRDLTAEEKLHLLKIVLIHSKAPKLDVHANFIKYTIDIVFNLQYGSAYEHRFVFLLLDQAGILNEATVEAFLYLVEGQFSCYLQAGILSSARDVNIVITSESFVKFCKNTTYGKFFSRELNDLKEARKHLKNATEEEKIILNQIIALIENNLKKLLDCYTERFQDTTPLDDSLKQQFREISPYSYCSIESGIGDPLSRKEFEAVLKFKKFSNQAFEEFAYSLKENQKQLTGTVEQAVQSILPKAMTNLVCQYLFFKEPEKTIVSPDNLISRYFKKMSEEKSEFKTQVEKFAPSIENFGSLATTIINHILNNLDIRNKAVVFEVNTYKDVYDVAAQMKWPTNDERYIVMILPTLLVDGVRQHATLILIDIKKKTIECVDSLGSLSKGCLEAEKIFKNLKSLSAKEADRNEEKEERKVTKQETHAVELSKKLEDFRLVEHVTKCEQQTDQKTCVTHCVASGIGMIAYKEKVDMSECDEATKQFVEKAKVDVATGVGTDARSSEFLLDVAGIYLLGSEEFNRHHLDDRATLSLQTKFRSLSG